MRKAPVTSLELEEYSERCDKILTLLYSLSERANHVSDMITDDRKEIDEAIWRLRHMIKESTDIYNDLRLIGFGSLDLPDYAVWEYFERVEDLEEDCEYIREDVLAEAKKVMRVV